MPVRPLRLPQRGVQGGVDDGLLREVCLEPVEISGERVIGLSSTRYRAA